MKRDLKEENEKHLNLRFSLKEKDMEIHAITERNKMLEASLDQLRSNHEKEKENIKEEYRQLYEKQMLMLKEAYALQMPRLIENENQ